MKPHEYVILEVARERERQMAVEGWTPEHDNQHMDGEMAMAAACYAAPERIDVQYTRVDHNGDGALQYTESHVDAWPWSPEWDKRDKHDRRRQLVIAGALIVAEIERLDRAVQKGRPAYRVEHIQ